MSAAVLETTNNTLTLSPKHLRMRNNSILSNQNGREEEKEIEGFLNRKAGNERLFSMRLLQDRLADCLSLKPLAVGSLRLSSRDSFGCEEHAAGARILIHEYHHEKATHIETQALAELPLLIFPSPTCQNRPRRCSNLATTAQRNEDD